MKTSLFLQIGVATCLALVGCGQQSDQRTAATNSTSGGSIATAPVDYLAAAARAQQAAVKTVDVTSLAKAIQLFNVDKGRNPKDLNELVEAKYMPEVPIPPAGTKIVYDANSGEVKVVKQ